MGATCQNKSFLCFYLVFRHTERNLLLLNDKVCQTELKYSLRFFDIGFGKNSVLCVSRHYSKNYSGSNKASDGFLEFIFQILCLSLLSSVYTIIKYTLYWNAYGTHKNAMMIFLYLFQNPWTNIPPVSFAYLHLLQLKNLLLLIKHFWGRLINILIWKKWICLVVYELMRMLQILELQIQGAERPINMHFTVRIDSSL